eukprot:2248633-Prymnesium_polylepis.2
MEFEQRKTMNLADGKVPMPRAKKAQRYGMLEQDVLNTEQDEDVAEPNDLEAPGEPEPSGVDNHTYAQPAQPRSKSSARQSKCCADGRGTDSSFAAALVPGARIRIQGLSAAAHHNGKEGVIIGRHEGSSDRFKVHTGTGEVLALRPANLSACGDSPGLMDMIAALERAGEHQKAALLRGTVKAPPRQDLE